MVHILIVTHGPLADAFKDSTKLFFGDEMAERIQTIGLFPSNSPEELKDRIEETIRKIDDGGGVVIFVDMFAGSPFNITALSIDEMQKDHKLECYTGVNMPLVMEALAKSSSLTLEELKDALDKIAEKSIVNLKKALDL